MDIPKPLIEQCRDGRVVLFLGAGASIGAVRDDGAGPPSGLVLRDLLVERFLDENFASESLAWVAELAQSATDLGTVQDFVAKQFEDLRPAEFHRNIPTFSWRGLVTTNYDRLLERTYSEHVDPAQQIVPFISNQDRIDELLRTPRHVGLIKLHGCVSRTHDERLPLILTVDQYVTHLSERRRLFKTFAEWATENPVVFVGQSLLDQDLRASLLRLSKEVGTRPRYYLVTPNVTQVEIDFWAEKRITVLSGTFEQFIKALDSLVPATFRGLIGVTQTEHPIEGHLAVNEPLESSIKDLLTHDVEFIHASMEYADGTPQKFYKGFDLGWYPVIENLDVRRRLTDQMLGEVIALPEEDRPTTVELYLIRAEAGAGKTTLLRRIAWEAATDGAALCLFLRSHGVPDFEALRELYRITKQRLFLFVDDPSERVAPIARLINMSRKKDLPITILTAERINEWNVECGDLSGYVTEQYDLRYLNRTDIELLVGLLEKHKSLGPNLTKRTVEERVQEFEKRAGRQLLVALHEATLGVPFEDILIDEYENIYPQQAQKLYLTVCVLNRLGIPVRAGLISRVHNITFDEFRERLFAPLEHVVRTQHSHVTADYDYAARHPEIAQIVFDRVLTEATDRFNEYIRILRYLNISYSSDRKSFRALIKAKQLHAVFPRCEDVTAIFQAAVDHIGRDAYLLQQIANYERIRPDGNYAKACELLSEARSLSPQDATLVHTLAEVLRVRAKKSQRPLERLKLRKEARALLLDVIDDPFTGEYAAVLKTKLEVDELRELLAEDKTTPRDLDEVIRRVERNLERGKQRHPDNSFLLTLEAEFGNLLEDSERSREALKSAHAASPRDPFLATRLSAFYQRNGELGKAQACLQEALEGNRTDKRLNFAYGSVLRALDPCDSDTLEYHFRRAFTKWDDQHEAQFWFARYAYESSDSSKREDSRATFRKLRDTKMSHEAKTRVRDRVLEGGHAKVFTGEIARITANHGFIIRDGPGDTVFFHKNGVKGGSWADLVEGVRVAFEVGFTFRGAIALKVEAN